MNKDWVSQLAVDGTREKLQSRLGKEKGCNASRDEEVGRMIQWVRQRCQITRLISRQGLNRGPGVLDVALRGLRMPVHTRNRDAIGEAVPRKAILLISTTVALR